MLEVLCSRYPIPFHRLPSVSREPLEFPACSSGSVSAQALQDEVKRDTRERNSQGGQESWHRALWQAVLSTKKHQEGEGQKLIFQDSTTILPSQSSGWCHQGMRCDVLYRSEGPLFPDPKISKFLNISSECLE